MADYNLTLDGSTGAISQVPGTPVYQEPFSVECVVTAHQTSTASFEAKVRIAMDWFAYGVPMLMFLGEAGNRNSSALLDLGKRLRGLRDLGKRNVCIFDFGIKVTTKVWQYW